MMARELSRLGRRTVELVFSRLTEEAEAPGLGETGMNQNWEYRVACSTCIVGGHGDHCPVL